MQTLEYIESVGGVKQYFDTGYYYKGNSRIKTKVICYSNRFTAWQGIFGSYGNNAWWTFYSHCNNTLDFGVNLGLAWDMTSDSIHDVDMEIESNMATGLTTWKSATDSYSLQQAPQTTSQGIETLKLFTSGNWYSIQQNEFGKYRFYYMEMYEGDTLVHKWVPVKDENDVICLYDVVDGVYKYNQGSTPFVAGPAISPTIKYLDYIKNDGATQYINTKFNPNQNTRVVMEVTDTGRAAYWFGAWNYAYNNGAYACCNDYGGIYSGYDGQGGTQGSYVTGDATIDMNKNVVSINGSTHRTFSESTFQVNYPLYLFGQNRAGTFAVRGGDTPSVTMEEFKLVSCQIYDNGTLVRDFVPAMNELGIVGLYDKLNDVFYAASGSGRFSYGRIKAKYKSNGTAVISLTNYIVGGDDSLQWSSNTPTDTSIMIATSVDQGEWKTIANGAAISDMGDVGDTCNLRIRVTLSTEDEFQAPSLSEIKILSRADKKILVITPIMPDDLRGAVGDISVLYDGLGGISGEGGPTTAFVGTFTPVGMTYRPNPYAEEHIEVSASANVVLTTITYYDTQETEHIGVSIAARVVLTDIHDL